MARPSKYNWEAIKKSYEDGFTVDKLCDMYNIEKKHHPKLWALLWSGWLKHVKERK